MHSSRDEIPKANFGGWRFSPHCFLYLQKDPKGKTYKTGEGIKCYDHSGVINRVHKQINGQDLISPHYPPTAKELGIHE